MNVNVLAVVVGAVVLFVLSTAYYVALTAQLEAARAAASEPTRAGRPAPWKMALEIVRNVVLVAVVAGILSLAGVRDAGPAIVVALALWVAFPGVLWTGAVLWEGASPRLAAIHAGDWLLKLIAIALVVSLIR